MAWFERKKIVPRPVVMFDIDKVKELNHLSPIQIVELVCSAFQIKPENAVLMNCDPDTYSEQFPNIAHMLRVHRYE